jgi:osmotically-inducible protein OsmY
MRTIIRSLLIVAVVAFGAFVLLGYWNGPSWRSPAGRTSSPVGTSGAVIDTEKARERGAELGEKAAVATEKVRDFAREAALTTKIKAKMALDDSVKARTIDVATDRSTVTLTGTVGSVAEHDRALALARETDGVSAVVDRLKVHVR